jgi:hypothetical protein
LANYVFLRYVGGDRENEESQKERYNAAALRDNTEAAVKLSEFEAYKRDENSFWPKLDQVRNKWAWIVVACGAAGVLLERVSRSQF